MIDNTYTHGRDGIRRGGAIVAGYAHLLDGRGWDPDHDDCYLIDALTDMFMWAADVGHDFEKCVEYARLHYRTSVIGEKAAIAESRARRTNEGL